MTARPASVWTICAIEMYRLLVVQYVTFVATYTARTRLSRKARTRAFSLPCPPCPRVGTPKHSVASVTKMSKGNGWTQVSATPATAIHTTHLEAQDTLVQRALFAHGVVEGLFEMSVVDCGAIVCLVVWLRPLVLFLLAFRFSIRCGLSGILYWFSRRSSGRNGRIPTL